jgi:hypothetical protein
VIQNLHCGGLNVGGGGSTVAEGGTPENATSRFIITGCVGSSCTFGPTTAPGPGFECTNTGCNFGPPLPIFSGGTSTCVLNTFSAPGSGMVDLSTGQSSSSVPLTSAVFLTSNATAPCPRCVSGTCQVGQDAGDPCTTTNSFMTTHDCRPLDVLGGTTPLGTIAVDLTPLTTGLAMKSDAGNGAGEICPGQMAGGSTAGCFGEGDGSPEGEPTCRRIEENGIPSGPITPNGPAVSARLASVFCIPATGAALIDGAASLPGPGATSLPGMVSLHN